MPSWKNPAAALSFTQTNPWDPGLKKRKGDEKEENWIGIKHSYDEIAILPGLVLSPGGCFTM